jgi:SAM-dependent methyltransferase
VKSPKADIADQSYRGILVVQASTEICMPEAVYDGLGQGFALAEGYALRRRPDPRIASAIVSALADARTVVNVGAGTGSYEPKDRIVQAVEPSEQMISQRPGDAAPCVRGSAESLPFGVGTYDAAMAVLTIHHWSDWRLGLREMRRVARRRIVLLTIDTEVFDFWLTRDYFPDLMNLDRKIMPKLTELASELGQFQATPVLVPHDCTDGFLGAYWRRPSTYLDPDARRSMSSFAKIDAEAGLRQLALDLESGVWRTRNADLLARETLNIGYRLLRWDFDPGYFQSPDVDCQIASAASAAVSARKIRGPRDTGTI